MRKISTLVLVLISISPLLAQVNEKDDNEETLLINNKNNISFSYGIGTYTILNKMVMGLGDYNPNYKTGTSGAFSLKYERLISPTLSVGFTLNYLEDYASVSSNDSFKLSVVKVTENLTRRTYSILVRTNFYYMKFNKLDNYVGVGIGYRKDWKTYDYKFDNPDYVVPENERIEIQVFCPIGFEFVGGVRYLLSKNVGFFGEFGFAKAALQCGFTASF